jgi:hypothetical protein
MGAVFLCYDVAVALLQPDGGLVCIAFITYCGGLFWPSQHPLEENPEQHAQQVVSQIGHFWLKRECLLLNPGGKHNPLTLHNDHDPQQCCQSAGILLQKVRH